LGLEKFRHLADVTIDSNGHIIKGREENTDMYAAIDLVMDKIDIQLKKFRDKMRKRKGDRSRSAAPEPAEAEEARALPTIKRKQVEVPALQLPDAVELMQSGKDSLLVFTDVTSGDLKVLYRRPDGNYILVEPIWDKGIGNRMKLSISWPQIVFYPICKPPTKRECWRNWPKPWRQVPMALAASCDGRAPDRERLGSTGIGDNIAIPTASWRNFPAHASASAAVLKGLTSTPWMASLRSSFSCCSPR